METALPKIITVTTTFEKAGDLLECLRKEVILHEQKYQTLPVAFVLNRTNWLLLESTLGAEVIESYQKNGYNTDTHPLDGQTKPCLPFLGVPVFEVPDQKKQEAIPNLNAGNNNEDNKWAIKFPEPEDRKRLLEAYLKHCREGLPDECFSMCNVKTLKKYFENYPEEFPTDQIEAAKAERQAFWVRMGINGTMGIPARYKTKDGKEETASGKFNDRSWKFIMQNMFKWKERTDVTTDGEKISGPTVFIPQEIEEEPIEENSQG